MKSFPAFKLVRMALAIGALVALWLKVQRTHPLERLAGARLEFIALAVVVVILDGMARAWNWRQLIRSMHVAPTVGYGMVLRLFWSGAFLGQVVPSTAGTDALRAILASRAFGGRMSEHAAAVVVLNIVSLAAGCAVGLGVAAWLFATDPQHGVRPILVLLFAAALGAALILYYLVHSQRGVLLWVLRRMRGPAMKVRRPLRRFTQRLIVLERHHIGLLPILAVAVLTLVTRATMFGLIGYATGIVLPAGVWASLVPGNMLSGLIPYSVAGYGGDQAAMVYFVTAFGISAGAAVAFALILPLMAMTFNMLGGLFVMSDHGASRSAIQVPERPAAD
ncbi:MAG TPA: lysylphosphatidylglycerol synthase transmembrane domain-containing protein [Steroidobacteraceae bacterium]|jgi:uncharacterized membrane protein YbhN (UPF0104 family)|nr:lysylphosphatidylglycerol synthase transmembrane domain-containing protein [Steroidobacteraceae bacterium]